MNSTNIDITISNGSRQQATPRESASEGGTSGADGAFAQLFAQAHRSDAGKRSATSADATTDSDMLLRQEIAADPSADGASNSLVALSISPQLEVITPGTSAPDPGSVEAFARSQGLDEDTVKWLFNPNAVSEPTQASLVGAVAMMPSGTSGPSSFVPGATANVAVANPGPAALNNASQTAASLASSFAALSSRQASGAEQTAGAASAGAEISGLRNALFPTLAVQPGQPGSAAGNGSAMTSQGDLGTMIANDLRALLTGTPSAQAVQSAQAAQVNQGTQINPIAQPPLAITAEAPGTVTSTAPSATIDQTAGKAVAALTTGIGAMIANGLSALQTAPQTTAATPVGTQAAESTTAPILLTPAMSMQASLLRMPGAKSVTTPAPNTARFAEVLIETIDLESELLETSKPGSSAEGAPRSESGSSTAMPIATESLARRTLQLSGSGTTAPSAPLSPDASQTDKISELADRLGQAIGERLVSAMERGQWQLKLMLKPAQLGHIEVEMRMRNGELDASFLASQAATRDLLQDGLARLKSTLNSLGMDVASMQVGDGQARQSGEKPTQERQAQTRTNMVSRDNDPITTGSSSGIRNQSGSDGLDVMV